MDILTRIANAQQADDDEQVADLTLLAIESGIPTDEILDRGRVGGMNVIGEQFLLHEIFLPDVLLAASAMYAGLGHLRPLLAREATDPSGRVRHGDRPRCRERRTHRERESQSRFLLAPCGDPALRGHEKVRIASGGGSLGWGIGAAMGAKIGDPDRQVVLNISDESVMYSASGFWTMVRYEIPVLTVAWNNHNYQTVRHGFSAFGGKMAKTGHHAGMHPDIDFVGLAKSQRVEGERVVTAGDLTKALAWGTAATRAGSPYSIDTDIGQIGGGAGSSWYQTFSVAKRRTRHVCNSTNTPRLVAGVCGAKRGVK